MDDLDEQSISALVNIESSNATPPTAQSTPDSALNSSDITNKIDQQLQLQQQSWTPENKEGKKRYDRDFLLSFRDKPLALIMPDNVNPCAVLKHFPKRPKIQVATCIRKNATLCLVHDELELAKRAMRLVLNKLTRTNLKKLAAQLTGNQKALMMMASEERLDACVNVIVEHAGDEHTFTSLYAELCKACCENVATFRDYLLARCEQEFNNNCDFASAEKAKRRSIGNVRLIGELFNVDMLAESAIDAHIERLLKHAAAADEATTNLERLCRLLATAGKKLDTASNSAKMNSYLESMERIANNSKLPIGQRVRFMLRDLIDLRKSAWVSRRQEREAKLDMAAAEMACKPAQPYYYKPRSSLEANNKQPNGGLLPTGNRNLRRHSNTTAAANKNTSNDFELATDVAGPSSGFFWRYAADKAKSATAVAARSEE